MKWIACMLVLACLACAQRAGRDSISGKPWSERIAASFLARYPEAIPYNAGNPAQRWNYEPGLLYVGFLRMYDRTGDPRYLEAVRSNLDLFVGEDGSIRTYKKSDLNLDMLLSGRALLAVHRLTGDPKYLAAADTLRSQLRDQPRNPSGGFWHKKIYPNQMWLDGIYMAEPFYTEYSAFRNDTAAFRDIAHQILLIAARTRDETTGLLHHGWDESRSQRWADSATGKSPHIWGRALGWFTMGVLDVLDTFPEDHPLRDDLLNVFQNLAGSLERFQHTDGLWFQVVDQGDRRGNYTEASASAMFTYALAKGARLGYLPRRFADVARTAFRGIVTELVTVTDDGLIDLHRVCSVAGLGGDPYRDGSYEYYVSEPQRTNDFKGVGAFLLAAIEIERLEGTGDRSQ